MVYGRYNELDNCGIHGFYKPTFTSLGSPIQVLTHSPCPNLARRYSHGFAVAEVEDFTRVPGFKAWRPRRIGDSPRTIRILTNLKKNWFCQERMVFWRSVNTAVWFNLIFQDQSAGFFTKQTNKQMMDFTSSDDMEFNLLWLIWNTMTDHWIFRLRHAMCEVKIGSEPTKVRDSNHSNR